MPPSASAPHFRGLERLYADAAINRLFDSRLEIGGEGEARIHFTVDDRYFHAGGAAHGSAYFKMLDDAAFYACNSLVTDRFLLTTSFNLFFTRPLGPGPVVAEGRWVSGRKRVFVGEARLIDADGHEAARGTGTFMRSAYPLASLKGYSQEAG